MKCQDVLTLLGFFIFFIYSKNIPNSDSQPSQSDKGQVLLILCRTGRLNKCYLLYFELGTFVRSYDLIHYPFNQICKTFSHIDHLVRIMDVANNLSFLTLLVWIKIQHKITRVTILSKRKPFFY